MKKTIGCFLLTVIVLSGCVSSEKPPANHGVRPDNTILRASPPYRPDLSVFFYPKELIIRRNDGSLVIGEINIPKGKTTLIVIGAMIPRPAASTRGSASNPELNEAIDEATLVINNNPNDIEAYLARITLLMERGRRQDLIQVINDCDHILKIDDTLEIAYYFRGMASAILQNNDQTIQDMSSLLAATGYDNIGAMYILGRSYFISNNDKEAIEFLQKVYMQDPDFLDTADLLNKLKERN